MPNQLVGLSLSSCIAQILRGQINEADVLRIYTATTAETPADWDKMIQNEYKGNYWHDFPEKAVELVGRLKAAGKILQPAIDDSVPNYPKGLRHNYSERPWLDVEAGTHFHPRDSSDSVAAREPGVKAILIQERALAKIEMRDRLDLPETAGNIGL